MTSSFSTGPEEAFGRLAKAFAELAFALDRTNDLAFALFETDPEVQTFVARVTDNGALLGSLERATFKAWYRNEFGKRDFWFERARQCIGRSFSRGAL